MSSHRGVGSKRQVPERIAVIDLGSNTARLQVFEVKNGELKAVAGSRRALKLMREVGPDDMLSEAAQQRVRDTLDEFIQVANDADAGTIVAVATSAIRSAANGAEFVAALAAETGISVAIIDGDTEARCSFWGAISSLDVTDGYVVDIGGGSLEIAEFHDRQLEHVWMRPLGSLRLSDNYLLTDPPTPGEIKQLIQHVATVLAEAGIPKLKKGEVLVGTGGTVRNLASVFSGGDGDAADELAATDVAGIAARLGSVDGEDRADTPGLSPDRSDSIVGGALALAIVMQTLGAKKVTVSKSGLREGVALELMARRLVALLPKAPEDLSGVA